MKKELTKDQKEKIVEGARVAEAQPTDFWKQVEQRMNIRDNAVKVQPRRVKD